MIPRTIPYLGPLALMVFFLTLIGCQHYGLTGLEPAQDSLETIAAPAEHPEAKDLFTQAEAIRSDARRMVEQSQALLEQATAARRMAGAIQRADAAHATLSPPSGLED